MNAGLWTALGFVAGSACMLAAMRRVLKQRYLDGKADGYCACYDVMEPRITAAHQRGRAEGYMELGRALVRDIGPEETRLMVERMEAMDKAEAAMRGKRS